MTTLLPKGIRVLGDPHLGKKFINNVPLHRRGDREEKVWEHFVSEVMQCDGVSVHVCMGDLFDKFQVPASVVLQTFQIYKAACAQNPSTTYVVIRGNHDASRDSTQKSSFDIFEALCDTLDNMVIVSEKAIAIWHDQSQKDLVFLPWHPFKNASEIAADVTQDFAKPGYVAFGHWDILSFDEGGADNLIPYEQLKDASIVITGHYHLAQEFEEAGTPVIVTGSMQPYSHAEDKEGRVYVTHTLAVINENLAKDPNFYEFLNLRMLANDGDVPPEEINCYSFSIKRASESDEVELDVDVDAFDLASIFRTTFEEFKVTSTLTDSLWTQFKEVNHD